MDQVSSINAISLSGERIGNRIRIILSVLLTIVVALTAMGNPLEMNIFYFTGLFFFIVITIINIIAMKRNKSTLILAYVTVFIEVSIPNI